MSCYQLGDNLHSSIEIYLNNKESMIDLLVLVFFVYLIKRIISRVFDLFENFYALLLSWSGRGKVTQHQLTGAHNHVVPVEPNQTATAKATARSENKSEKKEATVNSRPQPKSQLIEEQPAQRITLVREAPAQAEQPHQADKPQPKPQLPKRESAPAAEQSNLPTGSSHSQKRSSHLKDLTIQRDQSRISEQSKPQTKQRYFRKFEEVESPPPQYKDSKVEEYQLTIEQLRRQIEGYKEEKKMYIERIEDIIQHVSQAQDQQINEELVKNQDEELVAIRNLKIEINNAHQLEREKEQLVAQQLQETLDREKERIRNDYEEQLLQLRYQLESMRKEQTKLQKEFEDYRQEVQTQKQQVFDIKPEKVQDNSQRYVSEISNLKKELQQSKKTSEATVNKLRQDIANMHSNALTTQTELTHLKDQLIKTENDKSELQMRLTTENESLTARVTQLQKSIKESFEAQLLSEQKKDDEFKQKYNQSIDKFTHELQEVNNRHQAELDEEKFKFTKKLEEVQEELRFCQEQIQQFQINENKLREDLDNARALPTPKRSEKSYLSGSQVQNHPEYLKVKSKLETLESQIKRNEKSEIKIEESSPKYEEIATSKVQSIERKINYAKPLKERDPSPSFPSAVSRDTSSPAEVRSNSRAESNLSVNSRDKMNSVILAGVFDRRQPIRYQTPLDKPVVQSTVFQGGIMGETFFGETNILSEKKRKFVIGQINRLKKISAKKTKLLYRSLAKNNKPITDFTSNVPNLFLVVELANKKVLGAFTQTAFTKDLNHSSGEKSKYVSQNKSMIMDITNERVFVNQSGYETIRHDCNALIWGRNELVVNCEEPLLLSSDLNCESAIYACDYSSSELLGANESSCPISQFEVFRIFLG